MPLPEHRLDFLLRPPRSALLFALRTTVTALLALSVATLLGLKNPHWAAMTVIVVAQPTRGMVLAKGFYRAVGSLIGACVGVLLLLSLAQAQPLLILALAVWVGLCTAAVNLLRGFRSYGAVLAAITAALVAMLAFEHPLLAIEMSATRLGEVLIGVVASVLSAALLLPDADRAGLLRQARRLTVDALTWAGTVLRGGRGEREIDLERRLVADIANLDDSADQIAAGAPRLQARLPYLRGLMGSTLALIAAVRAVALHGGRSDSAAALAERLTHAGARLSGQSAMPPEAHRSLESRQERGDDPVRPHLIEIERALAAIEADIEALAAPPVAPPRGLLALHRDWDAARLTGLRAFIAVMLVGALWLVTGWAGGAPMLMTACLMCAIFAAHPMPARGILSSLQGAILAFATALTYRLLLMPDDAALPWVLLSIAPVLLIGTLTIANRATAIIGTELSMMFLFMSEPGLPWRHAPEHLLVLGSGIVLGVAVVSQVFARVLPIDPGRRWQLLRAELVGNLQRLAGARSLPAARKWRAGAYHRVLRLVLRAGPAGEPVEATVENGLAALTIGNALLQLQDLRRRNGLPPPAADTIGSALTALEKLAHDPLAAADTARACAAALNDAGERTDIGHAAAQALIEIAEAATSSSRFFHLTAR